MASRRLRNSILPAALTAAMVITSMTPAIAADTNATMGNDAENHVRTITNKNIDPKKYLDYSNGIDKGVYQWYLSDDGSYYYLAQSADKTKFVYTSANITDAAQQSMMICVPTQYMKKDSNGNVTIDPSAVVNGYTARTAPIVYENICYGWMSSTPRFQFEGMENPIESGYIFVVAGARSRNLENGKCPTPVVDLKAGVIELKANDDVIPGDKNHIISLGMSGGGQMSSILGASGNMDEYYSYMYESGILGVTKVGDTYKSVYDDSVFAAQTYSAIADLENADIAYAWMWYDTSESGGDQYKEMGKQEQATLTEFQKALQQDEAEAFVEYVNSLNLKDLNGNELSITPVDGNLHTGTYYDAILKNLSDSLNNQIKAGGKITDRNGDEITDLDGWAVKNEDGTYSVTDLLGYLKATKTVNARNKNVPGFDTLCKDAENNAFGTTGAVHYSRSVAQILKDNLEKYSNLDGYEEQRENIAEYISILEDKDINNYVETQTNLMNATEILLGNDGLVADTPAKHWRIRSGAVDEHTSYTISYNLALAANANDLVESVDYAQPWGIGHSSKEGTSTGSFVDWVAEICPGSISKVLDPDLWLDYSEGLKAGVYGWTLSEDKTYYALGAFEDGKQITKITEGFRGPQTLYQGVYTSTNITNDMEQSMMVYVPAAYLNEDGTINHSVRIGEYTADTAPIIFENNNAGWKSGTPKACATDYIKEGMIYVSVGSRSRDAKDQSGNYNTGKAPTPVIDLKAGIIALRANRDVIPGNTERIISVGTSGAGQMSSILGASGNMNEYYPYMYTTGVLGVTKNADGSYSSKYADNIYGAQCFCPIADLENADLAYAWMRYDSGETEFTGMGSNSPKQFSEFQLALQEDEAYAFVEYINSLNLKDINGKSLTLTSPRSGSYYEAVLQNMSNALNSLIAEGEFTPSYENTDWLVQNTDGSYSVTDMAGFIQNTGTRGSTLFARNKDIPGFDTFGATEEGDAFGYASDKSVHFSASVAQILKDNYYRYCKMDGFNDADVDEYIENALTGDKANYIDYQTNLMNATEILLGNNGLKAVNPAPYWRTRNGTADEHTSFTVAYNICLAANMAGLNTNYGLVWNMGHGSAEGTSTGTFIDWVKNIVKADREGLNKEIQAAKALNQSDYTASTWTNMQTALKAAETVYNNTDASKATVEKAINSLKAAVNALKNKVSTTITLKDKTTTYNGKTVSIGTASVQGSKGKITYSCYSDKACKKSLKSVPKNAGIYYVKATVAADDNFKSATSNTAKLTIKKAPQKLNIKTSAKTISKAKVKKAKQTFNIKTTILGKAKVSFKKVSGSKNLTVNSKGKVTVKKGIAKGTYKMKVKVSAKATTNYAAKSATKTITVKVK